MAATSASTRLLGTSYSLPNFAFFGHLPLTDEPEGLPYHAFYRCNICVAVGAECHAFDGIYPFLVEQRPGAMRNNISSNRCGCNL